MKRFILLLFISIISNTNAQCAMCKAVIESGDKNVAEAVNSGITYLMIFPYLLVGILAYFLYKHKRSIKKEQ